jgi:cyclophilin family peptidyl-prolyl cis-trans isomerase
MRFFPARLGTTIRLTAILAAALTTAAAAGTPAGAPPADTPAAADDPGQPVVTHRAVITTTLGQIEVELYGLDAPKTVKNFVELAQRGFYNGLLVHRVIPGFIIQTGDPQTRDTALRASWGRDGESIYNGEFEDELNPQTPSFKRGYVKGTLAMANRGPNTNTSQFFIMLADDVPQPGDTVKRRRKPLRPVYTIFGRVTRGMDIVEKIGAAELSKQYPEMPASPIALLQITTVEVKPAGR